MDEYIELMDYCAFDVEIAHELILEVLRDSAFD